MKSGCGSTTDILGVCILSFRRNKCNDPLNHLAGRRPPPRPQTSDSHGLAVSARNPCRYGLAAAPVRLVNRIGRNDAAMTLAPGIPEAGQGRRCLAAGIEGTPSKLIVFGPMRDQTELASQCFPPGHGFVTCINLNWPANKQRLVARPNVVHAGSRWRLNEKLPLQSGTVFEGLVMTAHAEILSSNTLYG